ncbi:hypothetical protein SARC_08755 [Sphaeroforma arctica JP610]|uniref:Uncharacterized protein n=1 Tax=Sphaeroforma arctica JP610 TaxID=667725 RepID=A0A0L0FS71_9EUKA|nr:hypothetical protein SARC_08755 [Sphaeroforma arctica JP610]KNC78828.1 hypothetical protein SARC_08755 [Sphaeroforma arctica JP610]|eukprot:XP_014152730.1 hypothetical protein SARC_08755 [Sphaeroforma arctica JP610]
MDRSRMFIEEFKKSKADWLMLKGLRYDGRGQAKMVEKKGVDQVAIAPPRMWIISNYTFDQMASLSCVDALWNPIKKRSVAMMFRLREDDEAMVPSLAHDVINNGHIVVTHVLQILASGDSMNVVRDLRTYGHFNMRFDSRCTKEEYVQRVVDPSRQLLTTCLQPDSGYLINKLSFNHSVFQPENHHLIHEGCLYVNLNFVSDMGRGIAVAWRDPRTKAVQWSVSNQMDPRLLHSMQIPKFQAADYDALMRHEARYRAKLYVAKKHDNRYVIEFQKYHRVSLFRDAATYLTHQYLRPDLSPCELILPHIPVREYYDLDMRGDATDYDASLLFNFGCARSRYCTSVYGDESDNYQDVTTLTASSDVDGVSDTVDWAVYGRNQMLRAPYAVKLTTRDVEGKRTYSNIDGSTLKLLRGAECLESMSTTAAMHASVICCPGTAIDPVHATKPVLDVPKPSEPRVVVQTCPKETGLGMSDKLSTDEIAVHEASIRTRFCFGRCRVRDIHNKACLPVETTRDYFRFAGLVKSIFGYKHGCTIFTTYVARSDYYNENADKVETSWRSLYSDMRFQTNEGTLVHNIMMRKLKVAELKKKGIFKY